MNNCTVHTAFGLLQLAMPMPYTHVFVGDAETETGKKMMPFFFKKYGFFVLNNAQQSSGFQHGKI
jgi:hypothetical protein